MTCREFAEFLIDYFSGAVSAEERFAFDAHLAVCPTCVAYLKSYQQTVTLGKAVVAASSEEVPEEVPEELVRAILASRKK